ncbi:MAG: hypothetical protein JWP89_5717 [Schlesneria sp.]|nr:hypothetical protein [Schlesneria sp.]
MTDQPPNPEIEAARLRSNAEAADASWAGVVTALVGTIAILVTAMLVDTTKNQDMVVIILISSGCGCFWLPIGLLSGWLAHKCFAGTDFPPSFVAVILASIGMLSTLGWGFVAVL